MDMYYQGKHYLKKGFSHPGLWDFIKTTKTRLAQPLTVPAYATAKEGEYITAVSEKFQKDPYANRILFHDSVDRISSDVENVRPVPYGENPLLYQISMFASRKLFGIDPVVYLYAPGEKAGYAYNAFALSYMDKAYIYISDLFFRNGQILSTEELLYLVGHELGHAQCHHTTLRLNDFELTNSREFSADRAGMIVCGLWLRETRPELDPQEIGRLCVRACAGALSKISIATYAMVNQSSVDWTTFDYSALDKQIGDYFQNAANLARSKGSHPSHGHRFMAATFFSESELFYEYLGYDPGQFRNLRSRQQLENAMYHL